MTVFVKTFGELTTQELYDIIWLRLQVFAVEQKIAYQDLDYVDRDAVHVWIEENGRIAACARVYRIEDGFVKIGRVASDPELRGKGYGKAVMEEAVRTARGHFPDSPILIHSQAYATGFYEKFGFRISSDKFLEEEIEHYEMQLSK